MNESADGRRPHVTEGGEAQIFMEVVAGAEALG
jgi:hypothetical protein